jgi:DNA-binding LacI/PurR family transcriptional regulator
MRNDAGAPSLADVARAAGVSLATASRAINNAYGVSEATRQKVLAVVEQLDFVASPDAERLARGTTRRVALVVPHLERWFFGEMVAGIERELSAAGVDILLYRVHDLDDRREFFSRLPARRKVDAVIAIAFPVDVEERRRLELMGVAITAAGGQSADYPYVSIDDYAAGRQAVDHLLDLGHTRIGMLASYERTLPAPRDNLRSRAYFDALAERGIPADPALVKDMEWGARNASLATAELAAVDPRPTAIYAHSDELALGAWHALTLAGARVPDDVSVVAIDDSPLAETLGLTSVHQPVREQGTIAARMVLTALDRPAEGAPDSIVVPTRLVERGSTRSPIPTHR